MNQQNLKYHWQIINSHTDVKSNLKIISGTFPRILDNSLSMESNFTNQTENKIGANNKSGLPSEVMQDLRWHACREAL